MTYSSKNYYTLKPFSFRINIHDSVDLPAYSFVMPMYAGWVPNFVKDRIGRPAAGEVYAYTRFGFIIIPEKLIGVAE